jgi:hypothetical protein
LIFVKNLRPRVRSTTAQHNAAQHSRQAPMRLADCPALPSGQWELLSCRNGCAELSGVLQLARIQESAQKAHTCCLAVCHLVLSCAVLADTCKQKLSSMPAALSCSAVLHVLTLRSSHYLRGSVPAKTAQDATRHMQQQPRLEGARLGTFPIKLTPGCFPYKRLQVGLQWQGGKRQQQQQQQDTQRGPSALPAACITTIQC